MLKLVYANLSLCGRRLFCDDKSVGTRRGRLWKTHAEHVHTFTYIQMYADFVKDSLINLN